MCYTTSQGLFNSCGIQSTDWLDIQQKNIILFAGLVTFYRGQNRHVIVLYADIVQFIKHILYIIFHAATRSTRTYCCSGGVIKLTTFGKTQLIDKDFLNLFQEFSCVALLIYPTLEHTQAQLGGHCKNGVILNILLNLIFDCMFRSWTKVCALLHCEWRNYTFNDNHGYHFIYILFILYNSRNN